MKCCPVVIKVPRRQHPRNNQTPARGYRLNNQLKKTTQVQLFFSGCIRFQTPQCSHPLQGYERNTRSGDDGRQSWADNMRSVCLPCRDSFEPWMWQHPTLEPQPKTSGSYLRCGSKYTQRAKHHSSRQKKKKKWCRFCHSNDRSSTPLPKHSRKNYFYGSLFFVRARNYYACSRGRAFFWVGGVDRHIMGRICQRVYVSDDKAACSVAACTCVCVGVGLMTECRDWKCML